MTSSRLTIQFQQQLLFILTYKNNVGCIWFPSRKKGIKLRYIPYAPHYNLLLNTNHHGLRTPREEIAFTARPKTQSQSQIFRYGGSIFCLPHRPNFSDIYDLCLHWVSVVHGQNVPKLNSRPVYCSQLYGSPICLIIWWIY